MKTIESAVQPEKRYFDLSDLQGYKCGDTVRSDLLRLGELSRNLPLAVKVSPLMFCLWICNPAGYCHVKVQEDALKCYSKDCKTFVAKAKQNKAKNICIHVRVLRANPCKNRPKSPIRGKAQKIKIALLLHSGRSK